MTEKYDFIFIVLVYRNTQDLNNFFDTLHISNSKVIVVNSFYNEETKKEFETIALNYNADFINLENKGYGYGNNRGCEFALKNYDFKYLVISNADIEIKQLSVNQLSDEYITAPKILTLTGKRQNPYLPYNYKWYDWLKYKLLKSKSRLVVVCWIFSRLLREFYLLFHKRGYVYSAHGAFVIIPKKLLEKLYPIYNEKMFLFCEEEHFAKKAKSKGIKFYYNSEIIIHHKEDGSVGSSNLNINNIERESYIEYYKTWYLSL